MGFTFTSFHRVEKDSSSIILSLPPEKSFCGGIMQSPTHPTNSRPRCQEASPVTGAWRRWSPKTLLHYSIQSFISSISILIFCTVVCYGIRSPLVGSPRFGQDGATPWLLATIAVVCMSCAQCWLRVYKNKSGIIINLLPFWRLPPMVTSYLLYSL